MRSIAKGMWQIVGEDLGFIGDLDVHDFADNSVHSLTWRASRDVGDYRKSLAGCWGDTDRHTGASGSRSAFSSLGAHLEAAPNPRSQRTLTICEKLRFSFWACFSMSLSTPQPKLTHRLFRFSVLVVGFGFI